MSSSWVSNLREEDHFRRTLEQMQWGNFEHQCEEEVVRALENFRFVTMSIACGKKRELLMEFWWNCASIWECSFERGRIRKESGERDRESRVLVRGTFCRTLDEMQERIWTSRRGGVRCLRISEAVERSRWLDEEACFLTLNVTRLFLSFSSLPVTIVVPVVFV
jgi:hypothetical protein